MILNKKYLSIVSLFMILLIVNLPVVSALNLESFTATSSSGTNDVIKESDSVKFDILIDLGLASMTPAELLGLGVTKIVGTSEHLVDSCEYYNNGTDKILCTKSLNINLSTGGDVFDYTVVFDTQEIPGRLYLDERAPDSLVLDVYQAGNFANFKLSARDVTNVIVPGICAGLDSYEIYYRTDVGANQSYDLKASGVFISGNCDETVNGSMEISGLKDQNDLVFCAYVKEKFGYNSSVCSELEIDLVSPKIENVTLINSFGEEAKFAASGANDLYFSFDVTENELLNESMSEVAISRVVSNALVEDILSVTCDYVQFLDEKKYSCKTSSFQSDAGSIATIIKVTDYALNQDLLEKTFTIEEDVYAPELTEISGGILHNSKLHFGRNATIKLKFKEKGMGFNSGNAFVRIDYDAEHKATTCYSTGSESWTCDFNLDFTDYTDGDHVFDVGTNTADDAGNFMNSTGEVKYDFVIDRTPPVITSYDLSGVNELGSFDFVSAGGKVRVNYSVEEESSFTGAVDFSGLILGSNLTSVIPAVCANTSCFVTSDIISEGGFTGNIILSATDLVGNNATEEVSIKVLPIANESNHWSGEVSLSPSAWDREVYNLINQKAYAQINLVSDVEMTVVDIEFDECITPEELSEGDCGKEYFSSVERVSYSDDLKQHYISLESKQADAFMNSINVECRFRITSYSADELVIGEEVTVPISIGLYNNPIGMQEEVMQQKIDAAVADTEGFAEDLDKLYDWVGQAEKLCNMYSTITGVVVALKTILGVISHVAKVPIARPYMIPVSTTTCGTTETVREAGEEFGIKVINKFCSWLQCESNILDSFDSTKRDGNVKDSGAIKGYNEIINYEVAGEKVLNSESLPSQILNFCIPGVLKKAHEYRAIKCTYVLCLVEQVETGNFNEAMCSELQNEMECKYTYSEAFSAMPFSGLLEKYMSAFEELYIQSDSVLGVVTAISAYCKATCVIPGLTEPKWLCGRVETALSFSNSLAMVADIGKNFKKYFDFDDNDKACEDMEDVLGEYENSQAEFLKNAREKIGANSTKACPARTAPEEEDDRFVEDDYVEEESYDDTEDLDDNPYIDDEPTVDGDTGLVDENDVDGGSE